MHMYDAALKSSPVVIRSIERWTDWVQKVEREGSLNYDSTRGVPRKADNDRELLLARPIHPGGASYLCV